MLKTEEIRALSKDELTKQLETAYRDMFDLRFRAAAKQLVNHRELPRMKRNIARIKTIIKERKLADGEAQK